MSPLSCTEHNRLLEGWEEVTMEMATMLSTLALWST